MVDQSYGLRFDIYERVHLSEEMVGIEELEEIELFPRIQVIPGDDYAALRGHLLLSGLYRGESETRELEHWIPVEITIPLSRVSKLEDIAVEIENFDVDLLSARSLNITGVLSLQGIETSSITSDSEGWNDREYVAAHEPFLESQDTQNVQEPQAFPGTDIQPPHNDSLGWLRTEELSGLNECSNADEQEEVLSWSNSFASAQLPQVLENDIQQETLDSEVAAREPENPQDGKTNLWFQDDEKRNALINEEDSEPVVQNEVDTYDLQFESELAVPASSEIGIEHGSEQAQVLEEQLEPNLPQAEEKKEMKIALGSKKNPVDTTSSDGFGITNLISGNRIGNDAVDLDSIDKQNEDLIAAQSTGGDGEDLQWKKLFIRSGEQEPFRKVKLVIVQQEETLDDIAQRYHLSSRELQLYNRLSEQQLAEGQVLYIP